ncbi:MAG: hypothetical protein IJ320_06740, partial [Phascolarctobacterium sp.]|nr:hypothetical protein [Phascolarctobacterium sp.]
MNKIYKVVWSKVKNCYVVVSELAKNIITGGVKSVKVGHAPMARGLALGAMMAFVITGSAMYDGMAEAARYEEGAGQAQIVDSQGTNKDRLVGGWGGSYEAGMATAFSGNLIVNVGNWDYIIGGNYASVVEDPAELKVNIEKTEVVINDGVYAKHVVGGTAANDVNKLTTGNAERTAHLVINGGTFGDATLWGHGTLENLVVGGDHVKGYAATGYPPFDNSSELNLASALTEIKGGTFNSLIIGGSLANQYGAAIGSGVFKTTVDKAETIITGGTFNQAIVAGGVAMGGEAISNVGEAVLSVANATVNSDIYTGGIVRYIDTKGAEGAEVEKSTVTIENSTVKNVYGVRGYADFNSGWTFMPEDDKYPNGSSAEGFGIHPTTSLTIEDSDITGEVDIRKGSITLEGDNTIGSIYAGADTTVDVSGNTDVDTLQVEQKELNFNGNGTLEIGKSETKNMKYTADDGVNAKVVYSKVVENTDDVIQDDTLTFDGVDLEINAPEGKNAIGAGEGKSVVINSNADVDINGQIEGSGANGNRAEISVAGNDISVDTAGEDAVRGFLSNITINAEDELNITSRDKDAIQSVVSKVELNAKTVNLTAGYDGWGINATGDAGNDITVNAENINIDGELGGIQNLAKSTIEVTTDNIMIDAGENEALRAVNQGVIAVNADKSAAITGDVTAITGGSVTINFEDEKSFLNGAVTTDDTSKTTLTFNNGAIWNVTGASRVSTFNSNQSKIAFEKDAYVHVDAGSGSLILTESGKTADDLNTVAQLSTVAAKLSVGEEARDITAKVVMAEGKVKGETTGVVSYKTEPEDGYYYGYIAEEDVTEKLNTTNASINNTLNVALMAWRAENNDMNKRLGELRNANGEHGVWVRMVNGESEYKDVENEYKTYQLGYDEKLSVDPSWTVGAAVSYTEADTTADKASGENKHKGFSVYGS